MEKLAMADKKVACDCGKTIHAKTDDELIRAVQEHAQSVHSMNLSREQVLAMAEPA
jgi:predicted small metal-binding protein